MTHLLDRTRSSVVAAASLLPRGRMLPEEVWRRRHRTIVRLAAAQVFLLLVFGLARGLHLPVALAAVSLVGAPLALAAPAAYSRKSRSAAASVSLFAASVVLVQFWDGRPEAHFHFFVMVGVVALYQDWIPFGIGLLVIALHHGVLGTLDPSAVYGHRMQHPWTWMLAHAGFVLAASAAHLAAWRLNEQQGLRDPLTGLANRTLVVETLTRSLARHDEVSVLFIDLDDFKNVNDTRGHAAGDQLLITVATRLRSSVRSTDLVARLGGDEFAVLVTGDADAARLVGERFLATLAHPVAVEGSPITVHASLGVADTTTTDPAVSGLPGHAELVRNADIAMYWAKATGKNRLVIYTAGMSQAARGGATLGEDLARAVERGQLELEFLATVEQRSGELTGHVTGYEALVRWRHPHRGVFAPAEFLPLAEANGDVLDIGEWVLRTATVQAAAWSAAGGRAVSVSVNVSAAEIASERLLDVVVEALRDSGLPPQQLTLELPEPVVVAGSAIVAERFEHLRAAGVRIAVDDLGTGCSGLAYLRGLPVDAVKVDRTVVAALGHGGLATPLVSGIVEFAHSLGLDVVAEGVETEQQAHALRDLGCTRVQGPLHGRPLAAEEVAVETSVRGETLV